MNDFGKRVMGTDLYGQVRAAWRASMVEGLTVLVGADTIALPLAACWALNPPIDD